MQDTPINYPALRAASRLYRAKCAEGVMPSYDCDGSYYDYSWCWEWALKIVAPLYDTTPQALEAMDWAAASWADSCMYASQDSTTHLERNHQ